MPYEWDADKNKLNIQKHHLSFEEAINIFNFPLATGIDKRKDYSETRYISVGTLGENAIILVVYTKRKTNIRIISARIANKKERRLYYEYISKKA
jgi:uncharacterized protein